MEENLRLRPTAYTPSAVVWLCFDRRWMRRRATA